MDRILNIYIMSIAQPYYEKMRKSGRNFILERAR